MSSRQGKTNSHSGSTVHANDPCWCGSGKKFKRCHRSSAQLIRAGQVTPGLSVPEEIKRPDYALNTQGRPALLDDNMVRPADVVDAMRKAGKIAAAVLQEAADALAPGITTDLIDRVTHEACIKRGAYPSPLGYHGYPKSVCTSVNEVICHGIPDSRPLADGDIVNIDVTVFIYGVHADTNATFFVGNVDDASRRLVQVTAQCLDLAIAAVKPGRPISDIGKAIQTHAEGQGYGVVRAFVGHGVARTFHCPPSIPHYFDERSNTVMQPGMTFTIEPMITMGNWRHVMWDDGWTAVTADNQRTAQFEHTLLVTDTGAETLTLL